MRNPKAFTEWFGPVQLNVLKEVGNIGAGHAATSLSKLLNKKIDMRVPGVEVVGFDTVMELAGGADKEVVSICQRIEGDAPGTMFFVLSPNKAAHFVQRMCVSTPVFLGHEEDDMALSALNELGNIVSGAYLTALGDFAALELASTVPSIAQDMVGAILSMGLIKMSQVSDQAIVIKTSFTDGEGRREEDIDGHFFLFPDPDSYVHFFRSSVM
ncbi:chemotaxis protein CheC [Halobacillus karajensis]|uniref:chemotaxis protein CheC n=1 Tax=Halobacillus karajensis TaxID=195088 RepID=UPI0008A77223|nr:chemotaxis protein CheC [Halobacillus karajensis]SEH73279.1 chemotaxis protein CheC [Halobacillus karajensis]